MKLNHTKPQKIISSLLIILIILPSVLFSIPKSISAQDAVPIPGPEDALLTPPCGGLTGVNCATQSGQVAQQAAIKKGNFWSMLVSFFTGSTGVSTGISAGQNTAQTTLQTKAEVRKLIEDVLKAIARRVLAKMTESTVNWINSGFHGSPLFLERPESFFKDIAKYEIKNLVTGIGYDPIGQPFGKNFALGIIGGFKSTFEQNAQYSLSKVTRDPALLRAVQSDFSVGGWDGFYLATQFPQNNAIGSNINYANTVSVQLKDTDAYKNAAKKVNQTLEQGQGFLSPKMCPKEINPNYNNLKNEFKQPTFKPSDCPDPDPTGDGTGSGPYIACVEAWKARYTCLNPDGTSGLVNTTPGTVVASQIVDSLNSGKRQGELAIAMGNSLSAIFDALLNQLFKTGLNSLSSLKSKPKDSPDDFNYFGNTLGPTSTTGVNDGFKWDKADQLIRSDTYDEEVSKAIDDTNKELQQKIDSIKGKYNYRVEAQKAVGVINPSQPSACPAGTTGTPPNCEVDETYLGPPIRTCPIGYIGTPPNCEVDLPPPPEAQ